MIDPDASPLSLFSQHKAIFVRVPKNASSSLMQFLYPGADNLSLPHFGADYYRRVFPKHFERYLVFSPLRNPIERFASAFSYYKHVSTVPAERRMMDCDLSFIKTFDDFVCWLNDLEALEDAEIMNWLHFRRQRDYICNASGEMIVDMLFPVEDMKPGLSLLGEFLGTTSEITHLNSSGKPQLDHLQLDRIEQHYKEDRELWEIVHSQQVSFTSKRARNLFE